MRKITTRHKKEKDQRLKQFIIGGVLILIMFGSVIGYAFQGKEEKESNKINYNGFEFEKQNNFWLMIAGEDLLVFKYNPTQIEEINSNLNPLANYYEKPLYMYSENNEAEKEIINNLFYQTRIVQRIQPSCPNSSIEEIADIDLQNKICEDNWREKNCEDNFILIKESETKSIIQKENCVFIQGPQTNLTELADEFLFKLLDIR